MGRDARTVLVEQIAAGNPDAVLATLEPLSERTREELRAAVAAAVADHDVSGRHADCAVCASLELAHFGTCAAVDVGRRSWRYDERHERVLRSRGRAWRQAVVDRRRRHYGLPWTWVYALVRDGLVDRPTDPEYIAQATWHLEWWHDDQDWLQNEFWELFSDEGAAKELSRGHRAYREHWLTTVRAYADLAHSGAVPRERLLDEALAALRRGFRPASTPFFRALIDALEPDARELAERTEHLLRLLRSDDVADVAFALRLLSALVRNGQVPSGLVQALEPAVRVPVKAHALAAVELAGSAVRRDHEHARTAIPVLIEALAHQRVEVQTAALSVIDRHRRALAASGRARLTELLPAMDPSVRARVNALLEKRSGVSDSRAAVAVPGSRPPDRSAPRLRGDVDELRPVHSADELLDRMTAVLTDRDDVEEIEVLMDALLRFPATELDPERTKELSRKGPITQWLFGVEEPLELLKYLFQHRLDLPRQTDGIPSAGRSPLEAILTRMRELLVDRPYAGLLSVPTHRGGWIDPLEAVRRVEALTGPAMPIDLAQMVLRLAPDHRQEALARARTLETEEGGVLTRALGGDSRPHDSDSRLMPAWVAAEQARAPDEHKLSGNIPMSDLADVRARASARRLPRLGSPHPFLREPLESVPDWSPATTLELENVWWLHQLGKPTGAFERWLTTVWPANREACYRLVARRLWIQADLPESGGVEKVLSLLLDPLEPVGLQASLALGLAMGADDVALRALSVDITAAAIANRRLDGPTLGRALAHLLHERRDVEPSRGLPDGKRLHAIAQRWTEPLRTIASTSALGAYDVQAAIEMLLATADDGHRASLGGILRLLRHLALEADAAVTDIEARAYLGRYSPQTAAGRIARDILAVGGTGASRSRAALACVVPSDGTATTV